jgi:general secretion pathway protein A
MNMALTSILRRLDDPAFLHANTAYSEALARLHFAVEHQQNLVALLGPAACGKTTLLRRFRKELMVSPASVVQLNLAGLTAAELRTTFAEQLGIRSQPSWLRIVERLTEYGYDSTPVVLLIDNAASALPEAFDFLARLWDADPNSQLQLTMIVATDELSLAQWSNAWLHRVDLRVQLEPWSLDDVAQFLQAAVGDERKRHQGFDDEAIFRIYELSGGLPRLVRRIARLSLLATQGQERAIVDDATVTGVSHELCHVAPQAQYHAGPAIEFIDDHFDLPDAP